MNDLGVTDLWDATIETNYAQKNPRGRGNSLHARIGCCRKARDLKLADLTVGDFMKILDVLRPTYRFHEFSEYDAKTLEEICGVEKVPKTPAAHYARARLVQKGIYDRGEILGEKR